MLRLAAVLTLALCLGSAEATVFDAGQALKADMLQSLPTNPYTDAHGGNWVFGKTTAVSGGTLTTFADTAQYWSPALKGFSGSGSLPTVHVNMGTEASSAGGLTTAGYLIAPGEIALHPENSGSESPYAIVRFTVPRTAIYNIQATFRDVSSGGSPGVDAHVVVNGADQASAIVSADPAAPEGSLQKFTADLRAINLTVGSTVDFVVGPNGAYWNDGTALFASVTAQSPYEGAIINLDFNGFKPGEDPLPGTNELYSGEGPVGPAGAFWNHVVIPNDTLTSVTTPHLKLSDGVTDSTVRFSVDVVGGGRLHADCIPTDASLNPLLDDYLYIDDGTTNRFTLAGLEPGTSYDLYFFSHAGALDRPGRFLINGIAYDSVKFWFTTNGSGDYAFCADVTADANGTIVGYFTKATGEDTTFDGLQIVGSFPRSHAELVNVDINGYGPGGDAPAGNSDTYSGAARVGETGDFWNSVAVADQNLSGVAAPNLKLANGLTNTAVCFSLSKIGGGSINGDRAGNLNPLLNDYVYILDASTNGFMITGLVPNATYDLYCYCHVGTGYCPGRFVINGVAYDSNDKAFAPGDNGDCAVCAGITADGSGAITGGFCKVNPGSAAVFNGFQIEGTFPRRQADIVSLDINGYNSTTESPPDPAPVAGDTFSGAARVGATGDYWNSVAIVNDTVASITVPHLKLADGVYNSTVTFSLSRADGGLLGADHIFEAPLNPLLNDYVYFYGETLTFTVSGLVPNATYDLYFYCHAGTYFNPGCFTVNGADYYSFDTCFAGGTGGDYAVCAGIAVDSGGTITGHIRAGNPPSPGVLNGLQIIGTIPRMPLGTVMIFQ